MDHRAWRLLPALLASAMASAIGCADSGEPLAMLALPEAEAFRFSSGLATQQRLVIRDAATWANLWSQIAANTQPRPAAPAIDFDSKVVIVVAMGQRPSGGYSIDIDSVRIVDEDVRISVTETSPGDKCGVTGALTQPIAATAVPRFDGEPTFNEHTATRDCK